MQSFVCRNPPLQFVHEDTVGHIGKRGATVLFGKGGAEKPQLSHWMNQVQGELLFLSAFVDYGEDLRIDKFPCGLLDESLFIAQELTKIHVICKVGWQRHCGLCRLVELALRGIYCSFSVSRENSMPWASGTVLPKLTVTVCLRI